MSDPVNGPDPGTCRKVGELGDRSVPQPSPDGIGIDGPADPADVVMASEDAVVHPVIGRLALADQGHSASAVG